MVACTLTLIFSQEDTALCDAEQTLGLQGFILAYLVHFKCGCTFVLTLVLHEGPCTDCSSSYEVLLWSTYLFMYNSMQGWCIFIAGCYMNKALCIAVNTTHVFWRPKA